MPIDLGSLFKIFTDSLCGPVDMSNPAAADFAMLMMFNGFMVGNWNAINNTLSPVKSFLASTGEFASVEQRQQIISAMLEKAFKGLSFDTRINLFIGDHAKDNSDPLNSCLLLANQHLLRIVDAYVSFDVSSGTTFAEGIHAILRDFAKGWHAALSEAFSGPNKALEFVKLLSEAAAIQIPGPVSDKPLKARMFAEMMVKLYTKLVNEGTSQSTVSR
ncbi:unnamed protein product [Phytomonas sp. Hart1]|nr:unnamed protein product [Phytomonas sp. Hart1]|eukprot:CCW67146.1 unnamed protein product [Phytomonas sp. isolate Hart1]